MLLFRALLWSILLIAGGWIATQALAEVPRQESPPTPEVHEEFVLTPGPERPEPWFGRAVAIANSAAIVSSPSDGDSGTANGVVHAFGDSKRGWRRTQRLQSSDPTWEDRFGQSLAADKVRLIVGRDRADDGASNAGAVTVYRRSGSHFKREAELAASDPGSDDGFGCAVSVSGSVLVVGASRDDDLGLDSGSAYVWVLRGDEWTLDAKLTAPNGKSADWFGSSVAIDGKRLVIGAYGADPRGEKSGAAFIFRKDDRDGGWTLDAELAPSDLNAGDWFGFSVALLGDRVAVGAPRDDGSGESAGCVRVFRREREGWELEATLRPEPGQSTVWAGYSLAMQGQRLLVGMPGDDRAGESSGAAGLYERISSTWTLRAYLTPSAPAEDELFGSSLALGPEIALIGKAASEDGDLSQGRAWIVRLAGRPKSEPLSGDESEPTPPAAAPSVARPVTSPGARSNG
jgi:hypothetical protein